MKLHGLLKKSKFADEYQLSIKRGDSEKVITIYMPFTEARLLDKEIRKAAKTEKGWSRFNLTFAPCKDPKTYPIVRGQKWVGSETNEEAQEQ